MDAAPVSAGKKRTFEVFAGSGSVNEAQTSRRFESSGADGVNTIDVDGFEKHQSGLNNGIQRVERPESAASGSGCSINTAGVGVHPSAHTGFVNSNLTALHEYVTHPEQYCSTIRPLVPSDGPSAGASQAQPQAQPQAQAQAQARGLAGTGTGAGQVQDQAAAGASPVLAYTDAIVLVRDKYPKAELHLLVLVRPPSGPGPAAPAAHTTATGAHPAARDSVDMRAVLGSCQRVSALRGTATHAQAVIQLKEATRQLLLTVTSDGRLPLSTIPSSCKDAEGRFDVEKVLLGFHALPSLTPLHLHVLSPDLCNGPCTKSKQHYNSFTTEFLVGIDTVIHRLQQAAGKAVVLGSGPPAWGGHSELYYQQLLDARPACHRCGLEAPNTRSFVKDLLAHARACKRQR